MWIKLLQGFSVEMPISQTEDWTDRLCKRNLSRNEQEWLVLLCHFYICVCVKGRLAAKDGFHLSKWRIKLIKMSQEEMTVSRKVLQAPDQFLSNCASCISCYLQRVYSVSLSVLKVHLSQILLYHTIWVLPQVNILNITATSDQPLQENRKSV